MSAADKKDAWSSEAYQHSASFVPKLATQVVQWLDAQKDDVVLDIGCGDGVLDVEIAKVLAQGSGSLHGVDSSPAMIEAAKQAVAREGLGNCTFEVLDGTELLSRPALQRQSFTKAFSNAALHWVLAARPEDGGDASRADARRARFFRGVHGALAPGGRFAFEMGGLGNVAEIRAAVLAAVGRRVGLAAARAVDPWFFPDEAWVRRVLDERSGWRVDKVERVWRPTTADEGGVEGWVRLMASRFLEAVPAGEEREACVREIVEVLETVCAMPGGGYMLSYVRLRVLAERI